jgi:transposase
MLILECKTLRHATLFFQDRGFHAVSIFPLFHSPVYQSSLSPPLATMVRVRKELFAEQRGEIIGAYQCGTRAAVIARTLGLPPSTVYATINRFKQTGSAQPKKRPGGPRKLSDRDLRIVRRTVLKGRRRPLCEITNEVAARVGKPLCQKTVRKYMAELEFHSCAACKKPLLKKENAKARLKWC